MRDLRIVFMGTPDFAVATLQALLEANHQVVGVITAPDRPAGRGQKLRQSAVKAFAVANELTVLQPTNLKDADFLETLAQLEANLQIVVAFRMLPKQVWKMPAYGTFNLHASLLPQYRGAAPINWAIINGEERTGVTTFFIDEKIDTGAIILNKEVAIGPTETAGDLHDRLMEVGAQLVLDTVDLIQKETVTTTEQPTKESKTAYKLHNDNTKIDWSMDTQSIYNHIRGLNPYPGAWCNLHTEGTLLRVKVFAAFAKADGQAGAPSTDIGRIETHKSHIAVRTKDGVLCITELQLPGKRKMEVKALLNGFTFGENAHML